MVNIRIQMCKVLLTIVAFIILIPCAGFSQDEPRLILDSSYSTETGRTLDLNVDNGNVYIRTWSQRNVKVQVYADSTGKTNFKFNFNKKYSGLNVTSEKSNKLSTGKINYVINIPSDYNLNIDATGEIQVDNLRGNVQVTTTDGKVTVNSVYGNLTVKNTNGDVFTDRVEGRIDINTNRGSIKATKFKGNVSATTFVGDVLLTGERGSVRATSSDGSIGLDYNGVNMGVELNTFSGNIIAHFTRDFGAFADISTISGNIITDFAKPVQNGAGYRIQGNINSGGSRFVCTTSMGSIQVTTR